MKEILKIYILFLVVLDNIEVNSCTYFLSKIQFQNWPWSVRYCLEPASNATGDYVTRNKCSRCLI